MTRKVVCVRTFRTVHDQNSESRNLLPQGATGLNIYIAHPTGGGSLPSSGATADGGAWPQNATVTVWLVDQFGNQTFATVQTTVDPNDPTKLDWTAAFPALATGMEYMLNAQAQYGGETVLASQPVNVPSPP